MLQATSYKQYSYFARTAAVRVDPMRPCKQHSSKHKERAPLGNYDVNQRFPTVTFGEANVQATEPAHVRDFESVTVFLAIVTVAGR